MGRWQITSSLILATAALWGAKVVLSAPSIQVKGDAAGTTRIRVVLSQGHETDPRDRGRPVVLIAAALGVPPEVFREAFSHVQPAPAGTHPDPEQVRRNKDALMEALSRYGVTNERLDEVSNYYRYDRRRGELWPTTPAGADAIVQGGKIVGFEITEPGSGYSSSPLINVPGITETRTQPQIRFTTSFETNGSLANIVMVPGKAQ